MNTLAVKVAKYENFLLLVYVTCMGACMRTHMHTLTQNNKLNNCTTPCNLREQIMF